MSLAFVREILRWPVNTPHKGPVKRIMCPFYGVIIMAESPSDSKPPKEFFLY